MLLRITTKFTLLAPSAAIHFPTSSSAIPPEEGNFKNFFQKLATAEVDIQEKQSRKSTDFSGFDLDGISEKFDKQDLELRCLKSRFSNAMTVYARIK